MTYSSLFFRLLHWYWGNDIVITIPPPAPSYIVSLSHNGLTHWSQDKMAAILQMTFFNSSYWMKIVLFWFLFQWILLPKVQLYANTMFIKIIGHIVHFRWLGPNVWREISQIWIEYIKPIRQIVWWSTKSFLATLPILAQIMAWHHTGNKLLSESMLAYLTDTYMFSSDSMS